jgi:hypothetical protein
MAEGNKALKWVGIGCLVLFLFGACGIGACVFIIKGMTDAPAGQAHGFLADLRTGNYPTALQRMNGGYQSTHALEAFQQSVAAIPSLTQSTDATLDDRNVSGSGATMSGHLTTPSGDVPITITLSQAGEHWYIDSVVVQGQTLQ